MIKFLKNENELILEYTSSNSLHWIGDKFYGNNEITINNVYTFSKKDLYIEEDDIDEEDIDYATDSISFVIATLKNGYYRFKKESLSIDFFLNIQNEIKITDKMFKAERNISIFKWINQITHEDIYIDNNNKGNLPLERFQELIKKFPNTYELNKYARARVSAVISDFFENPDDAVLKYEKYMNQKISYKGDDVIGIFKSREKEKYEIVLKKLVEMLKEQEKYIEKQWQREISQIILLLYPKYISVFEEAPVRDSYKETTRNIDFMLVDTNGNIDIIEIKRPLKQNIVSDRTYRDNHIPLRELSGSIMQIEKYIFNLNKWGKKGEDKLTEKYKDQLPSGFKIKITNPAGIVIMGRENNLSDEQKDDLEIIKRKYKSVIDIITYDELISRLKMLINKFS